VFYCTPAGASARRAALGVVLALAALAAWPPPALAYERYVPTTQGDWQKQPGAPAGTAEGQLQEIRKALAEGRGKDAYYLADSWIEQRPNHPMLVEAYFLRADAQVARRDYYQALYDYERVIREYPASEQFNTALEREFQIARLFAAGVKRKFWGMAIIPAEDDAIEVYIRIQERAPGSELGEKASMALGDYYFENADMPAAVEAYDLFLVNYPRSQNRERVMLRLIQASLATFKGPKFDPKGLTEAAQRLRLYQQEFPAAAERIGAEALLVRIDESMARKALYNAQWYEGQGDRVSAVYVYQRTVRDYPRTAAARTALDRLTALAAPALPAAPAAGPTTRPAATRTSP
jgi:outer membrane assembly lipoprotein YfiO